LIVLARPCHHDHPRGQDAGQFALVKPNRAALEDMLDVSLNVSDEQRRATLDRLGE